MERSSGADEISVAAWTCMGTCRVHLLFILPNCLFSCDVSTPSCALHCGFLRHYSSLANVCVLGKAVELCPHVG